MILLTLLLVNLFAITTKEVLKVDDVLWSFQYINPQELLLVMKSEGLAHYDLSTKKLTKLESVKAKIHGQGGYLDILYHEKNIYLTYAQSKGKYITVSLFKALYENKKLSKGKVIFQADIQSDTPYHFGSRLVLYKNSLLMTIGDRGQREKAQLLNNHQGKILRLTLEGKAYPENPFKQNPYIYSYGHRNPQGIDIDPKSQKIYSVEFGPRGGDELNHIRLGKNFGWPVITYGKEYWGPSIGSKSKKGMEQPVTYWVPSISPSGMVFYTGDKLKDWKGDIFVANLSSTHLRRLVVKDNKIVKQQKLLTSMEQRMRHVRNTPDGYLAVSTDSGYLYKILP